MEKIDFRKELKHLYKPSAKELVQVKIPEMNYVMIDGQGDPLTSTVYQAAVEALFALSYAIKFMAKKGFTEEGPTFKLLHRFIADAGRKPAGKHHEIYLSDIRKAAPEKWKTVIRQPMQ